MRELECIFIRPIYRSKNEKELGHKIYIREIRITDKYRHKEINLLSANIPELIRTEHI